MARTLRVPESLDGATFKAYLVNEGQGVRASQPIALFELDGKDLPLLADADGAALRLLMNPGPLCAEGAPIAVLGAVGESIGYDPSVVRCVRVVVSRRCDECGNDYPVNGLVSRVRCTRCGDAQLASVGYWRDYLNEHVIAARTPRSTSGSNTVAGKYGPSSIYCFGVPPLCRKCHSLLDWDALVQAWGKAQQEGTATLFCGQCGEPHRARLPPPWAAELFPGLVFCVGETAEDGAAASLPRAVIFKCPSCLAALDIDGVKRIVRCKYCDSDVYLPDDLWLHLNPAAKRARWWMLFRP